MLGSASSAFCTPVGGCADAESVDFLSGPPRESRFLSLINCAGASSFPGFLPDLTSSNKAGLAANSEIFWAVADSREDCKPSSHPGAFVVVWCPGRAKDPLRVLPVGEKCDHARARTLANSPTGVTPGTFSVGRRQGSGNRTDKDGKLGSRPALGLSRWLICTII